MTTENETILTGDATPPAEGATPPAGDATPPAEDATPPAEGATPPAGEEPGYELPEGLDISDDDKGVIEDLFTSAEFTANPKQAFVDFLVKQGEAGTTVQEEAYNAVTEEWRQNSVNDSEFGGDAFEQNLGIAKAAIDKFGTPELKTLLEEHGVGNHPEMFRFMWNVGKLLKEDNPGAGGQRQNTPRSDVEILYPKQQNS